MYKANDPKSKNIPDLPDFWLADKIFRNKLCGYASMQYYISSHISASLCITNKINGFSTFFYFLCDECSEDGTGKYSFAKYQ